MIDLDIVIVNWNAGTQLWDCLQSLQISKKEGVFCLSSCVIVDNASTDGSINNLEGFSLPVAIIKNDENMGFACASNQGTKKGSAEYILFLNPDIKLFPDSLAKALLFFQETRNEQIGILGIQLVDQNGIPQRNTARFPTPGLVLYQKLGLDRLWPERFPPIVLMDWDHQRGKEVDYVQGAFFLVRRKMFESLGGFDERFFLYCEDVDFSLRAKQAGWNSYYLADVQAFHQGGGTTNRIKGRRLFYYLYSLTQYIGKHFGFRCAVFVITVTIGIELWIRLAWSVIRLSGRTFIDTLHAYGMFVGQLPHLIKDLKRWQKPATVPGSS